ncbi:2-hydroxyacyl-CoA dehydratase family protein [Pseudoramibacter faecis]|uniref:2-hydroxyacyl-CoA dehydratase subunit D n=1 Tax=Pseudoramibacter faecis TaxID=3108534 RepID=UPI002E78C33E|nr:2-hydroxyacyl-CoA dehydratase family protein [Pseudoramibacter sp. HA2172]
MSERKNSLNAQIEALCKAGASPGKTIRATVQKTGKQVVGWVEPYAPVEIIDAAGCLPTGLWGGEVELKKARTYLPPFACSIMQSIMEMENDGTYDLLDAVLIPANCDTLKCFGQKWKGKCPAIPFVHPQHRDVPDAVTFLANEYQMIRQKLESILKVSITEVALSESIKAYNACRQTVRTFMKVAAKHLDVITPAVRHQIIKAYYFMEVREYTAAIQRLTRALRRETPDQYAGKKVVVTGLTLEPESILDIFEQFGLAIAADDLAHESRQFRTDVPYYGDPIHSLAKQWQNHSGCSLAMDPYKARIEMLVEMVRAADADGLVVALMKFCDPEEYDVPIIMDACKKAGIPMLTIEIDQQARAYEQIRTRLQSFAENLN